MSQPQVENTYALQHVYVGVCSIILQLLGTPEGMVLLSSQPDVLSLLVRSIVSLSEFDFTAAEPKPYFQFSDMLSLPVCCSIPLPTHLILFFRFVSQTQQL